MNSKKNLLLWGTVILLFTSCGEQYKGAAVSIADASATDTEEVTESDSARIIIKTAELKLKVDDVSQKIKEIQKSVNDINGHVMHYEVNANRQYRQELAVSLDSSMIIHEISPQGFMKVKVPVNQSDTFIHTMLSMKADIDKLLVDEEDVTEDLQQKKELAQPVPILPETRHVRLKDVMFADHKNAEQIMLKADYAKLNYRTRYLWFDINLQGNSYLEKRMVATAKEMHEPFYVDICKAMRAGWYTFSVFLVAALHLWPFILVALLMIIGYRKRWFRLIQKRTGAIRP